jgi:hypothetical protein
MVIPSGRVIFFAFGTAPTAIRHLFQRSRNDLPIPSPIIANFHLLRAKKRRAVLCFNCFLLNFNALEYAARSPGNRPDGMAQGVVFVVPGEAGYG